MKKILSKLFFLTTFLPVIALADGAGDTFSNPIGDVTITSLIETLAKFAAQIGAVVVVVMIIYSGFKFVTAMGNPGELDKAKKNFYWTIIGAAILMGAWVLASMIKDTVDSLS